VKLVQRICNDNSQGSHKEINSVFQDFQGEMAHFRTLISRNHYSRNFTVYCQTRDYFTPSIRSTAVLHIFFY